MTEDKRTASIEALTTRLLLAGPARLLVLMPRVSEGVAEIFVYKPCGRDASMAALRIMKALVAAFYGDHPALHAWIYELIRETYTEASTP